MLHPKTTLAPSLDIYLSVISAHVLVNPSCNTASGGRHQMSSLLHLTLLLSRFFWIIAGKFVVKRNELIKLIIAKKC